MNKQTIFLVVGECGEYSDHLTWVSKAFKSEVGAEIFMEECEKAAEAFYALRKLHKCPVNLVDPGFESDYTGTEYEIEEVELDA